MLAPPNLRSFGEVLRWLLPIFTVFALLGQAVTSYAAAGVIGESSCCCPKPESCKCHDHDGKRDASPSLERCGGEATLVAPAVSIAVPTIEPVATLEPRVTALPIAEPEPIPDDISREPQTPPF